MMGCNCCRMLKSYIYDPSVPVEVHGRKRDPAGSSLYLPNHHLPGNNDPLQKKQGFYNLGYNSSGGLGASSPPISPVKLDSENNHINRLHGNGPPADNASLGWTGGGKGGGGRGGEVDSGIRIPQLKEQVALKNAPPLPSVPPIYQLPSTLTPTAKGPDGSIRPWDIAHLSGDEVIRKGPYHLREGPEGVECYVDDDDDEEERESGVGSTPEYLGDTGDEASVLSGDINTSSTSLSSGDTRPGTGVEKRARRETEGGEEREDCQSVTDSMVDEALAALAAATAGEDYD
ncbi:uncharacterized protein zgc:194930 isoform X2 [Clupea harengus]|uniref:Uncharacterized protein zgc:194930 isoform X2 n=1 Tax=Clupea harengus TaxID=7950 RepID=A0A6P3W6G6_CLUHA|nr:uncharacterized protein zgc:194930 isoform X2 [Clupea harengus]